MAKKPDNMTPVDKLCVLAEEGVSGRYWYQEGQQNIQEVASLLGVSPVRFAYLVAALSPQTRVERNCLLAVQYASGIPAEDLGVIPSVIVALRHYEETGILRGPKTSAFAANLSGDYERVVLDTWMAKAFGIQKERLGRARNYQKGEERVRRVAKRLGWAPCEAQAAIWTTVNTRPQALEFTQYLQEVP